MTRERVFLGNGKSGVEDIDNLIMPTPKKKCKRCGKLNYVFIAGLCPECYAKEHVM
jgi:uncharacterized OB-fold protein